jgi:hypothetical protein
MNNVIINILVEMIDIRDYDNSHRINFISIGTNYETYENDISFWELQEAENKSLSFVIFVI